MASFDDTLANEVEALTAIYGSDFEVIQTDVKVAWKMSRLETSYRLRIRANDESIKAVSVYLVFKTLQSYPSSHIIVTVEPDKHLYTAHINALDTYLQSEVEKIIDREAMFELASLAAEFITDHNALVNNPKSAFDERQVRQIVEQVVISPPLQTFDKEENHGMIRKIQRDLSVKQDLVQDGNKLQGIVWDLKPPGRQSIDKCRIIGKRFQPSWIVVNECEDVFFHSQYLISNPHYTQKHVKATADLRLFFEARLALSHPNLCTIHHAKLTLVDNVLLLDILEDGSFSLLHNILNAAERFSPRVCMRYVSLVTDALAYLNSQSKFHGTLSLDTIFITDDASIKIHGSFIDFLASLDSNERFVLSDEGAFSSRVPLHWTCKDSIASSLSDVYDIGRLTLQLLYGSDVLFRYASVNEIDINVLTGLNLKDMLSVDAKKRIAVDQIFIGALDLYDNKPIDTETTDEESRKKTRYALDFEGTLDFLSRLLKEVEWLGKGAFGEVVKCVNLIDGRHYAIKNVMLKGNATQQDKIIREVLTLSRLHHSNVVRYYTAWVEALANSGQHRIDEDEFGFGESDSDEPCHGDKKSLFIQMEYCESKTLRHLIDKKGSISIELGWNIYKDILKGLAYIHSQGMIHRDLKPSNVFLTLGNVARIGDFGLATVNRSEPRSNIKSSKRAGGSTEFSETLTSDIGTATYSAPEIISRRYNSKVDLFSLGICFFEMIYEFETGMQRAIVLRDLRLNLLPNDIDIKLAHQCDIIRALASFDPSSRPTAEAALKDPRLPLSSLEAVDTLTGIKLALKDGKSSEVVKPFFEQIEERFRDFTFDFNSSFDSYDATVSTCLENLSKRSYFATVGASNMDVPLFHPKTHTTSQLLNGSNCVEFIDKNGYVNVMMPMQYQSIGFIRYVARTFNHSPIKRFSMDLSLRHPCGEYSIQFDQITPTDHIFSLVESIITCYDVCSIVEAQDKSISLNSMALIDCLIGAIGKSLDPSQRKSIIHLLSSSHQKDWNTKELVDAFGFEAVFLDQLQSLNLEYTLQNIDQAFKTFLNTPYQKQAYFAIDQIKSVMIHLQSIDSTKQTKVTFNPVSIPVNYQLFRNAIVFQVKTRSKKKSSETIAYGGDYNSTIQLYQSPSKKGCLHGSGWTIPLARFLIKTNHQGFLSSWLGKDTLSSVLPLVERRLDLILIQFGSELTIDAINILLSIRKANISAELIRCNNDLSNSELSKLAIQSGTTLYILLKSKGSGPLTIKIKNLVNHSENIIPSGEDFIMRLQSELASTTATKSSMPGNGIQQTSDNMANIKVTLLQAPSVKEPVKNKKRQLLSNRALTAVSEAIESFKSGQIFMVDLSISLVRQFIASQMDTSRILDSKQREYLELIRIHIQKIGKDQHVWIYSTVDSTATLVAC